MPKSEKITFGVDPGTVKTGVSMFRGDRFVRADILRAPSSRKPVERATILADRLDAHLTKWRGQTESSECDVVLEMPGAQGRNRGGKGMISLGFAVGMVYQRLYLQRYTIHSPTVAEWCRLHGRRMLAKERRAEIMVDLFPEYDRGADRGLDAADAIGLVAWHLRLVKV